MGHKAHQSAITCFLDLHDDSCMLDLKLHNLLTCFFIPITNYQPDQECYKSNIEPNWASSFNLTLKEMLFESLD